MDSALELPPHETKDDESPQTAGLQKPDSAAERLPAYSSPQVFSSRPVGIPEPVGAVTGPLARPLFLTLSKQIIYPTLPPAQALYHLSFSLDSAGHQITLSTSVPGSLRADGTQHKARDRDLYIIGRGVGFSIRSQSRRAFPGVGNLKLERHGLKGKWWELSYSGSSDGKGKKAIVLKGKDAKWTDATGAVVAEEQNEVLPKKTKGSSKEGYEGDGHEASPMLAIANGVEERMRILLVAVWCAKIWYKVTYEEMNGGLHKADVVRRVNVGRDFMGRGSGAVMRGFYAI